MPRPIILDCDPGTDDALALFLALASPELDVLAVTVAGGNVGLDRTLANALALVALTGSSVPVFAGADRPILGAFKSETRVHGDDGLGGVVLPPGGDPAPGVAADTIRAILRAAPEPVTLVGIAPITNFALGLAANRESIIWRKTFASPRRSSASSASGVVRCDFKCAASSVNVKWSAA